VVIANKLEATRSTGDLRELAVALKNVMVRETGGPTMCTVAP